MDKANRGLPLDPRPNLGRKDAFDFGLVGQRGKQGLHKPQTHGTRRRNQL